VQLSDLKVQNRLALAFGVVLVFSIICAGLALTKLSVIDADLQEIVLDSNVKLRLNNEMSDAAHVASRVVRSIVLLRDKADVEREVPKFQQAKAAYEKAWAALSAMPASEAGKANRAKIATASATTQPLYDRVLELGLADKDADATLLLMKEANPAATQWQEAIHHNIVLQQDHSDELFVQAQAAYKAARNLLIGANAVAVLVALLMGWLVTRSITRQLGAEPARATDVARSVAAGDLTTHVELNPGDTTSLMYQLKAMQDSLVGVVGSVRQNSDSVATASAQIAQGNHDLSQRTEEQASALQQTAASMEQLSSTVRQNADNARQGNQLALSASAVAVNGGEVVGRVVETMKGINDSSKKIADIISVIDGIAFQTNILALNAAVEAARAGEQGRGFAVVASEVRSLAQRSAEAAREIKALITTSVERVEEGTSLVDQAGATMQEVVTSIKRVTDIMGEISSASTEQSTGVAQVGQAVSQMDQATQQNAALVEQSAAAAESLKHQAMQLVEAVAVFKLAHRAAGGESNAAPAPAARVTPSPRAASAPLERRGPNRAHNVARLKPTPKAASKPSPKATPDTTHSAAPATAQAHQPHVPAPAPVVLAKTGTDDEWTSF
jgi:methyl-accepting chemotaxis protein